LHVEGHHDFWFTNRTASPVEVFLKEQSCKCTKVQIAVLPDDLKDKAQDQLDRLVADGAKLDWRALDKNVNKGVTVPAHGAGGVRLNWKPEQLGKVRLTATLWTESGGALSGDPVDLAVSLDLAPPLMVSPESDLKDANPEREIDVGTLAAGDTRTVNLLAWSATRDHLKVKVQPPAEPCIECGAPQELQKAECERLGKRDNRQVRCAYLVPVTVREHTEDGKMLDLGRFRKTIQFTTDEPGVEPAALAVAGMVRGDITVGTPEDHDLINLRSFKWDEVKEETIHLTSPDGRLQLEVADHPDFLEAVLKDVTPKGQVGKEWDLTVRVPPKAVNGEVRRARIVLTTKGDHPRRISIPVTGIAYVP
jgi:hypothetical protein